MWGESYSQGLGQADGLLPRGAGIVVILLTSSTWEKAMEANFDNTADQARATGRRVKNDLSDGISDIKTAASGEIKNLIADVEDLMARIADLKDADVVRVRGKVQRAVDAAKQSLADGAGSIRRQAQDIASTADDYVRESPWQAIGIAALVGAVVGILATRRS
jgi:ElaB/YqjD/DUF883 family membrane-anchored ribosome-binding protein